MSGILRLANTGTGTGRSTLQSNASNDVTFNLPDTGSDNTATILTSELHSITSVNWDGMVINITNANFNVDSGTLFVNESTNRVGIGTTSPGSKLDVRASGSEIGVNIVSGQDADNTTLLRIAMARPWAFKQQGSGGTSALALTPENDGKAFIIADSGNNTIASFRGQTATPSNSRILLLPTGGFAGIGTTSPTEKLEVAGDICIDRGANDDGAVLFGPRANQNFIYGGGTSDILAFYTNQGERVRIDSSGRLLLGTTSPRSYGTATGIFQVAGTTNAHISLSRSTNNATPGTFTISKSRGTPASPTTVSNGDGIGILRFAAYDGTDFDSRTAEISSNVDGTPGSNDMPGRLVFSTTADGTSGPTERLRIDSSGRIGLNSTSNNVRFFLGGNTSYTGTNAVGYQNAASITATTTANYQAFNIFNRFEGSLTEYAGYAANANSAGSGSCINAYAFKVEAQFNQATNNYGFYSNLSADSGRWNFYANGTAKNYFAGNVHFNYTGNNLPGSGNTEVGGVFERVSDGASLFISRTNNISGRFNRNSDGDVHDFRRSGNSVGTISVTTSATSYNTSSDYRLKENITPIVNASDRLKTLKPSRFNFIAEPDKTVDGFLAHEAQEVVPEAVTGEKDGEEMQAIDTSKLVPLLTAALQEALTEISELKERVKNLES